MNGVTSYDTVTGHLSTIKRMHELGGWETIEHPHLLRLELMAIKRELAHVIKKAPPITPEILVEIYKFVNKQDQLELVAFAVLVVGFTLFLRNSNLVCDTLNSFNSREQLTLGDLWVTKTGMMVEIKWSKTLQNRERDLSLPLIPAKNKVVCAVFWLKYIKSMRPVPIADDPVFAYMVNGHVIPLTYDVLSSKLKHWISQTGREGEKFSLHGLRCGRTNHVLMVGICGEDLQLMGDWKSRAYMEYIDLNMERRFSNMVKFVDEMDALVHGDGWLDI